MILALRGPTDPSARLDGPRAAVRRGPRLAPASRTAGRGGTVKRAASEPIKKLATPDRVVATVVEKWKRGEL